MWFDHRSYDQTTLMRMYKQTGKLNLKLHLEYMLKVETLPKGS